MSDRITAIIPKDATYRVSPEKLELARDKVVSYFIQGDDWQTPDEHVQAYWYESTKLFKESPDDIYAEYEWMQIRCNLCQSDVKEWWYKTIEKLEGYEQLNLPCPCSKQVINLNRLQYGGIKLYFVGFAIRIWNITSLLCQEELNAMINDLERLLGCELQTIQGRH
jgi:hypothetical protein